MILMAGIALPIQAQKLTKEVKSASEFTQSANNQLYKDYPFDNTQSFKDAQRGFIAPLPNNGVVKDAAGNVVWDLSQFQKFIKEGQKAPNTVNPSLWRQSQLMISGLFEVVPGVYQVRGADLSNGL